MGTRPEARSWSWFQVLLGRFSHSSFLTHNLKTRHVEDAESGSKPHPLSAGGGASSVKCVSIKRDDHTSVTAGSALHPGVFS